MSPWLEQVVARGHGLPFGVSDERALRAYITCTTRTRSSFAGGTAGATEAAPVTGLCLVTAGRFAAVGFAETAARRPADGAGALPTRMGTEIVGTPDTTTRGDAAVGINAAAIATATGAVMRRYWPAGRLIAGEATRPS
jgi:hypothetical protein